MGSIPWGTHLCQFYETKQDLIDILVPYFAEGLKSNEFCMWITSPPLEVEEATLALQKAVPNLDEYVKKGQIEIISYDKWYLRDGKFDSNRITNGWVEKENAALARGFDGLRLTGNTFWVERELWKSFVDYEEAINKVIGNHRILALCTYCLKNCSGTDVLDVVRNHIGTLIKQNEKWSIVEDITERKKVEDSLRKSEERYRSYIEVTGELGWTTNGQGEVVDDIPAFRKFTGQSFEEVKGWGWSKALHPDDFERTVKTWRNAVTSKRQYEIEYRLRRSDRIYRHFLSRGVPVFRGDGSVREWVGTCIDITSRKEMENELFDTLKASQSRQSEVSALLEASKAVLVRHEFSDAARAIFDSCKGLLGAKAGYVALISNDEKENNVLFLDSGGLSCLVDPSLEMPIRGLRAKAYERGKTVYDNDFSNSEWAKLLPKGHVKLQNVLFAPLTIDNKVVGIIGLANKDGSFNEHDAQMATAFGEIASIALINSRMLEKLETNENLLKAHSEQLEQMVEEKTKQLRDTERLAAIGATAGMVGHDIRNPLQAITCDLYLAVTEVESCPDSKCKTSVKESLLEIEKNIDYINKIVADLQDFARPLKPNVSENNLEPIIDEALNKYSVPENIIVKKHIAKDTQTVMADASYIKRILSNLINNAVQAMPSGGTLVIEAYGERKDVTLTVTDTGVGIAKEAKEKLFTPLFTTKSKGQGFGLAVVKRMAEALGGTVTFESQAGKGTKFIVRLPKRKSSQQPKSLT